MPEIDESLYVKVNKDNITPPIDSKADESIYEEINTELPPLPPRSTKEQLSQEDNPQPNSKSEREAGKEKASSEKSILSRFTDFIKKLLGANGDEKINKVKLKN